MGGKATSATDDKSGNDSKGKGAKPEDQLGDAGKKVLRQLRDELRTAKAELKKLQTGDMTSDEKLTEAEARAEKAEAQMMRLEVALDKGLSLAQAKRLSGDSRDELEADADEYLTEVHGGGKNQEDEEEPPARGGPSRRPKPDLKGGGAPEDSEPDEMDPRKLADSIPRA